VFIGRQTAQLATQKKLLSLICKKISGPFILCGDFNLPLINWNTFTGQDALSETFLDFCLQENLKQYTTEPTRNNALLDLILSNSSSLVLNTSVRENFSTSDHCLIKFFVNAEITRPTSPSRTRKFNKLNLTSLNNSFINCDWRQIDQQFSIDGKYSLFCNFFA